ncbi:MAG: T9SS type A sorting domain-containing protein [Bacteroidota bacterium]
MKTFTPLLFLLFALALPAQEWAPLGTEWRALWRNLAYAREYSMTYTKDTLIDNRNCAFIEKEEYGSCNRYGKEHFIAHFDSNRLYLYDEMTEEFFLLIDYNAEVGDHWQIGSNLVSQTISHIGTIDATVDSVGTVVSALDNNSLKAWYVNLCYTDGLDSLTFCEPKVILEKVGFTDMIYPEMSNLTGSLCDASWEGPLLCYWEPSTFFQFDLANGVGCLRGSVNTLDVAQVADVYPNPFNNNLTIKLKELEDFTITLYTTNGQQVLKQTSAALHTELELGYLESGVYFLQLSRTHHGVEQHYMKKMIRQ